MKQGRNAGWARYAGLLMILSLIACNEREQGEETGGEESGGGTVARHFEDVRPEGVSSPEDPVTTTYYIPQATIGDMYEIEAGGIAAARAKDPEVRAFARKMVEDHGKSLKQLTAFTTNNPANRATAQNLDPRRRAMVENLQAASDDEFEHVYLGQQAAAHDEAFNLHKSFASQGAYPELQEMAARNAETIEQHRNMLKALMNGNGR